MTDKPAILTRIDEALVDNLPAGIIAGATGDVLAACQEFLGTWEEPYQSGASYVSEGGDTVRINRSLAQLPNGWLVRVRAGFER